MISDAIKLFVESLDTAFVATVDENGKPHLAAGTVPQIPDPSHLVFEAWLCPTTLRNAARNPHIAVAVVAGPGTGYQFGGVVEKIADSAILDGYAPDIEAQGIPQVQYHLVVRVDEVMEFSSGAHTDRPL